MRSTARSRRAACVVSFLALLIAALYGFVNLGYPLSLAKRELPVTARWLIELVSSDFVLGDETIVQLVVQNFTRAFASISMHTAAGGLALILCANQFIPVWRRRAPAVHRAVGKVAALAIFVSMTGAIVYLLITPSEDVLSGQPYAAALWVLAVSTIVTLIWSMKAIYERDILAHMGWSVLLFATLLTAPLSRIEFVILGRLLPSFNIAQANAAVAVILFPQVIWLTAWWMQRVGYKDMPLLPPKSSLPSPLVHTLGWLGAATVLHEGLMAPLGWDKLDHWRNAAERLPMIAWVWAVPTALLLPRLQLALRAVMRHDAIDMPVLWLSMTASIGALLTATQLPTSDYNEIGRTSYWVGTGVMGLWISIAGMVWRQEDRRLTPLRVLSLACLLMPALWAPVAWCMSWTDWSGSAVRTATLTLSAGICAWHGFAAAFGLPLPIASRIKALQPLHRASAAPGRRVSG